MSLSCRSYLFWWNYRLDELQIYLGLLVITAMKLKLPYYSVRNLEVHCIFLFSYRYFRSFIFKNYFLKERTYEKNNILINKLSNQCGNPDLHRRKKRNTFCTMFLWQVHGENTQTEYGANGIKWPVHKVSVPGRTRIAEVGILTGGICRVVTVQGFLTHVSAPWYRKAMYEALWLVPSA